MTLHRRDVFARDPPSHIAVRGRLATPYEPYKKRRKNMERFSRFVLVGALILWAANPAKAGNITLTGHDDDLHHAFARDSCRERRPYSQLLL